MVEEKIEIKNPSGLHTRPAKRVVDTAKLYKSEVTIIKDSFEGDGKNLIKLLKLGISAGNTIILRCSGEDEVEAFSAIKEIILSLKE